MRTPTAILAVTMIAFAGTVPRPQQSDGVSITFVANEGVLLSSGSKKVLIDALFQKYKTFHLAPDSVRAAIEAARAPFDGVDLILVTHHHGDHFHPQPVAAHMRANPRARLVTSAQVLDSLRGRLNANDPIAARFVPRTTPVGRIRSDVVNGIQLRMLGLEHHGLEHLGYIVEIGGRRVLHVGDTNGRAADFAPLRLDTMRIDVALLPDWMVTSGEGRQAIERWIRPKQVIAIHVGASAGQRVAQAVRAAMPGARTFHRSLESYRF